MSRKPTYDSEDVPYLMSKDEVHNFMEANLNKYEGLVCHICGHTWKPRSDFNPRQCPSCKSTMWRVLEGSPIQKCIAILQQHCPYLTEQIINTLAMEISQALEQPQNDSDPSKTW